MPNVVLPLPNVEASVTHAMVADLADQVKKLLQLDYVKETIFVDEQGNTHTPSSVHGEKDVPNDRYARISGESRLWVEATEETNEAGWTTMVIERDEHYPIFIDHETGVNIQPIPVPTDLTLKFLFRTPNRDEAARWRASLMTKLARVQEGMQHTLTFSMNLPVQLWNLLIEIYNLRETKAPYGESFMEYIKQKCSPDLTLVSEASGKVTNMSFRRRLARVNGRFVVSPLPEKPVLQGDGGVWECVMEYRVTYDKPIQCRIRYPVMVHNNFLPDKYIEDSNTDPNVLNAKWNMAIGQRGLMAFETATVMGYQETQDAVLHIPTIDDFVPKIVPKSTATCLLVMCQMEEEGSSVLFNLKDLGDIQLDKDILDFFQNGEYLFLNRPFRSLFSISLYRDQDLVRPEKIEVNDRLDVICHETIDLRKTYRVRLSVVTDPALVDHAAHDRLNESPLALVKYLQTVNEAFRTHTDFVKRFDHREVKSWHLSALWRMLNGFNSSPSTPFGTSSGTQQTQDTAMIPADAWKALERSRAMRTVQIAGVLVHRQ